MEYPRPQPQASYTLIYFLLIAAFSQVVGESLQPIYSVPLEMEGKEDQNPKESSTLSTVSQFLKWTPAEASAFLPKIFRKSPAEEPQLVVEEINDDLLISDLSSEDMINPKMIREDIEIIDSLSLDISRLDIEVQNSPALAILMTPKPDKAGSEQPSASVSNDQSTDQSKLKSVNQKETKRVKPKPKPKSVAKVKKKRKRRKRRYSKSGVLIHAIEDEEKSLNSFYHKLAKIRSEGEKVRIIHYGDSLIAGDYVTRTVRRLLQKTFGDAGHGYFLAGKGSRWYGRRWIKLKSRGKWIKKRFTRTKKEGGYFGLGGVSFTSTSAGAWVKAKPTGSRLGGIVDLVEIHYLGRPNGGSFTVEFGTEIKEISTQSEVIQTKKLLLKAPKGGAIETKIQVKGDGEITLFGVVFERKKGGIVYDALGLEGARAKLLLNLINQDWVSQIKQRNPDLYILHYGTNESANTRMSMSMYKDGLRQVIRQFKKALPQSACMLVSPMDRGKKDPNTGKVKSMRIVSQIVKAQRAISTKEGCAFWSAYDAMGGWGSMARWYNATPKLAGGDLTHPTGIGANRIGAMFFAALMDGYQKR